MNRFRAVTFRIILEEKRLYTNGIVDQYPIVWENICIHEFELFWDNPEALYTFLSLRVLWRVQEANLKMQEENQFVCTSWLSCGAG